MDIALDLGTSNTRIKIDENNNFIDQPSVIGFDVETGEIISYAEKLI